MSDTPSGGLPIVAPGLGLHPDAVQAQVLARQGRDGAASSQEYITHDAQDPPYITAMEHFEGLSHEEIYEHVQAMNIGFVTALGEAWRDIANGLSAKVLGSRLALGRALSEGFTGEFAAAANTAADTFFDGADNLQRAVSAVGYRIGSVAGAAEVVKLSVPAPPVRAVSTEGVSDEAEQVVTVVLGAASPSSDADFQRRKEEQRQVAIGVMNSVYKPNYQPAGDGVPAFVPVYTPGDGPAGTTPGGTTPSPAGPSSPAPGSATTAPGTETTGEQPPGGPQTAGEPQTTAASTEPAATNPAATPPQATAPSTTQGDDPRGAPTGNTTTSPGTPSRPTAPGLPGTPGSPGAPHLPGQNVSGAPGSRSAPGATTSAAAAAARGGRPMSGMPGMMSPGAAARRGEDDAEHKTPDYLITDRSEELLGPDRPVVPPAIGADAVAAEPAAVDRSARDPGGHR